MSVRQIAATETHARVEATSDEVVSKIWFTSDPVDREFAYRAFQLQLITHSSDHGHNEAIDGHGASYFELVILKDQNSTEPMMGEEGPLVFRSHTNRVDAEDKEQDVSRHFGAVFDRRVGLLNKMQIGNVLGVRIAAQGAGFKNIAVKGLLVAKYLNEDLFSPMSWSLVSKNIEFDAPQEIENGVYCFTPTEPCRVEAVDDEQSDVIWFTTPVFSQETIQKLEDVQLYTKAQQTHYSRSSGQLGHVEGNWCWFDLVVLSGPHETTPRIKDGRALVWRSHDIPLTGSNKEQAGKLFDINGITSVLEPGNVIGVRACARFKGWGLRAKKARLVVRISYDNAVRTPPRPLVNWKSIVASNTDLKEKLDIYLDSVTPKGQPPAASAEQILLSQELRSDRRYGELDPPLRLLSLDGGGVRGISSLHILKSIMLEATGDPNSKPCDYFDMIAGTSTGGLIAIMLGRLRMSIDQCIKAYTELATKIFGTSMMGKVATVSSEGTRFSGEVLKQAIQEVVKEYTGDAEAPMFHPEGKCKVFVCAARSSNLNNVVATHLRTYDNKNVEESFSEYKIWEAARATSAAPTYFPPITLGHYEYVDGGLGFNNPVLLLISEARLHFGFARKVDCLVTIGTGMETNLAMPSAATGLITFATKSLVLVNTLRKMATNCEHANLLAAGLCNPGVYHRFNVGEKIAEKKWIEKVEPSVWEWLIPSSGGKPTTVEKFTPENWVDLAMSLDDYTKMDYLVRLTKTYLDAERAKIGTCASRLRVTTERILLQLSQATKNT